MKRLFVGIPLSKLIRLNLTSLLAELQFPGITPVEAENLHLTIKFLGEVAEAHLPEVNKKLEQISQHHAPFRLELKEIGVFPSEKEIRVVWMGVESEEMLGLIEETNRELADIHREEHKEEIPHLTLARVKPTADFIKLKMVLNKNKSISLGLLDVDKFYLFESKLTPNGPIYSVLGEFGLKMG